MRSDGKHGDGSRASLMPSWSYFSIQIVRFEELESRAVINYKVTVWPNFFNREAYKLHKPHIQFMELNKKYNTPVSLLLQMKLST